MEALLATTDLDKIQGELDACVEVEKQLKIDISMMLFQRNTFSEENNIGKHDVFSRTIVPGLTALQAASDNELEKAKDYLLTVGEQLDITAATASKVSSAVRHFDTLKERLKVTSDITHGMIDCNSCLSSLRQSLELKDYSSAAQSYERCKLLVKRYNLALSTNDKEILERAERIVEDATIRKFDSAIDSNNENEIIESYQALAHLGKAADGLKRYIRFLRNQMKQLYDDERLSYDDNRIPHVQLMSKLLNLVSELMQTGKQTVQACMRLPSNYGNQNYQNGTVTLQLGVILSELHKECDFLASGLVRKFVDDKNIVELIQKQQNKEEHGLDTDGMEIPLSGQVDYTLNECALITQHCENYFRWLIQQGKVLCMDEMAEQSDIKSKWEGQNQASYNVDGDNLDSDSDGHSVNSEEDPGSADAAKALEKEASDLANKYGLTRESLGRSATSRALQELASFYVQLEAGFMENNASDSFQRNTAVIPPTFSIEPDTGNIIKEEGRKQEFFASSAVEESFFIFQNCALRALASGLVDNYCAVINFIGNVISSVIIEDYGSKLRDIKDDGKRTGSDKTDESQVGLLQIGYDLVSDADSCATILNNMHSVTKYIERLVKTLQQEGRTVFYEDGDQDKIAGCLDMLLSYAKQCKSVLDAGLGKLASSHRLRVRGVMDSLNGAGSIITYDLSEEQFEEVQRYDPFRSEIVDRLRVILDPYRHSFSSRNFEFLVHYAIETVSRRVEGSLRRKHFSQYGGLKFERDVRTLIVFFSERSTRNVRKRFARLSDMALLLSADSRDVALEYIRDGSVTALNEEETEKTLGLRSDFATFE
eukprot:g2798.t1